MSGMASMQGGTVASTGLVNIQTLNPRPVIPRCRLPEDALLSSSRSSFISGAKLRTTRYVTSNFDSHIFALRTCTGSFKVCHEHVVVEGL
jgi:hypothetical protein